MRIPWTVDERAYFSECGYTNRDLARAQAIDWSPMFETAGIGEALTHIARDFAAGSSGCVLLPNPSADLETRVAFQVLLDLWMGGMGRRAFRASLDANVPAAPPYAPRPRL